MPLPEDSETPVKYEVEVLFDLNDFIPAINAPVLVSDRFARMMLENSTAAVAYPAQILHQNQVIRDDVFAVNFESCLDCVDEESSELEYLDLDEHNKIPYRYRLLNLLPSRVPAKEAIFRVKHCGDVIVSQLFRDTAEKEAFTGCEFFAFENVLL